MSSSGQQNVLAASHRLHRRSLRAKRAAIVLHTFTTVPKQLPAELQSKPEMEQIASQSCAASRRSGTRLHNASETKCYKLQASGPSFSMSALQNENKSRKRGLREWRRDLSFQRHPYLSHCGAISTQRGTLSNLLPDWYVTRGRNLSPLPSLAAYRALFSWQNFLSTQL